MVSPDLNLDEIETTDEAKKLHKFCQYSLQYLLHNLTAFNQENEILEEKYDINNRKIDKVDDILRKQNEEISRLKGDIKRIQNEKKHQKYLIETEKELNKDSEVQVQMMIERLKRGEINLAEEDKQTEEFRKSIVRASPQKNTLDPDY